MWGPEIVGRFTSREKAIDAIRKDIIRRVSIGEENRLSLRGKEFFDEYRKSYSFPTDIGIVVKIGDQEVNFVDDRATYSVVEHMIE